MSQLKNLLVFIDYHYYNMIIPLQKDSYQNANDLMIFYIAYIRDFSLKFAVWTRVN